MRATIGHEMEREVRDDMLSPKDSNQTLEKQERLLTRGEGDGELKAT